MNRQEIEGALEAGNKVFKITSHVGFTKGEMIETGVVINRGYSYRAKGRAAGYRLKALDGRWKGEERIIQGRDISNVWTPDDERRMLNAQESQQIIDHITEQLLDKGMAKPSVRIVSSRHMDGSRKLMLSFDGLDAEQALNELGIEFDLSYKN